MCGAPSWAPGRHAVKFVVVIAMHRQASTRDSVKKKFLGDMIDRTVQRFALDGTVPPDDVPRDFPLTALQWKNLQVLADYAAVNNHIMFVFNILFVNNNGSIVT